MEFIEIEKDNIPYRFDISIAGEMFGFEVHYNADYDFLRWILKRMEKCWYMGKS